ncbi:MAG TPA: DUF5676 family membrane protein [Pyrinomonadaceae bacterium]|nr:DUF5676 family membrane protein [Pyrinomonadaceae bacterium]
MKMNIAIPKNYGTDANSPQTRRARINVRAIAVTQSFVGAILFLVCSLLVVFLPEATAKFTAFAFHTDLTKVMKPLNFSGFLIGLFAFSLGFGLVSALAAGVYNNLTKNVA